MPKKKIIEPPQPQGEVSMSVLLYATLVVLVIMLIGLIVMIVQVQSLKKEIKKQEASQTVEAEDDAEDADSVEVDDAEEADEDDVTTTTNTNKNTNTAATNVNTSAATSTNTAATTNANTASTNNTTTAVDWETFNVSEYSIEYPSTWELDDFVNAEDSLYFGANPKGYVVPANTGSTVSVIVSVESTLEDKQKSLKDLGYSENIITFAGKESYEYTLVKGEKNKRTILVVDGRIFQLQTTDSDLQYVDEIFSSFKILK